MKPLRKAVTPAATPQKGNAKGDEGEFRLAISRDGVGIELTRPLALGPLRISELAWSFPKLKFPVDVSGGIDAFRHRQGRLERLVIEAPKESVARLLEHEARTILRADHVHIRPERRGAKISVSFAKASLAFDLRVDAEDDKAIFIVDRPRGLGLTATPLAAAFQLMSALAPLEQRGSVFEAKELGTAILRQLLPSRGFRVPTSEGIRPNVLTHAHDAWILQFARDAAGIEPDEPTVLAKEWAHRLSPIDDAMARSQHDKARSLALAALEDAPDSVEVLARILEIDRFHRGREEAALSFKAGADLVLDIVRAELYERRGDTQEAIALYLRAAEAETAPSLAALLLGKCAELTRDASLALTWIDRAVQRAPRSEALLWERFRRNLELGRIDRAEVDAELLEALATTEDTKLSVWRRVAFEERNKGISAVRALRRALRYRPNDPALLASLGRGLSLEGDAKRGAALLQQSIERAPDADFIPEATLDLAEILGRDLGDTPLALYLLAKLGARATIASLALEGRLRVELHDRENASLAYARLRSKVEGAILDKKDAAVAKDALVTASRFEEVERRDLRAAERHIVVALQLAPTDPQLRDRAKSLQSLGARSDSADELGARGVSPLTIEEAPVQRMETIESLTDKLRADPKNDAIVEELASLLEEEKRFHDLIALLAARIDEGGAHFQDRYKRALTLAKADAEREGRGEDAFAFATMLESL